MLYITVKSSAPASVRRSCAAKQAAKTRRLNARRAAHAARACQQSRFALRRKAFAHHAAHKALAVKHIALQPAIGAAAHGIARARNLRGGRDFV